MAKNLNESVHVKDDGTNFNVYFGNTLVFKIRKTDNQLLLQNGVDADAY